MPSREYPSSLGMRDCKAQSMSYFPLLTLIHPYKSGEDWQSGCIARCPAVGSIAVGIECEDRRGCCGPTAATLVLGTLIKLVKVVVARIDYQNMGIAARFDRRARGDRHRPWVALIGIVCNIYGDKRLCYIDCYPRNAIAGVTAEIGMDMNRLTYRGDIFIRIPVNWQVIYSLIPGIISWKNRAAPESLCAGKRAGKNQANCSKF